MLTESAIDLVRERAIVPLGNARDMLGFAVARARLVRDGHALGSREYYDAKAVVEDIEASQRHLDRLGVVLARPDAAAAAAFAGVTAPSPQRRTEQNGPPAAPPKGYTTPPAARPAGGMPRDVAGAILRTLLTGSCGDPNCESCKAAFGGPQPANGTAVGVTDRAG